MDPMEEEEEEFRVSLQDQRKAAQAIKEQLGICEEDAARKAGCYSDLYI